MDYQITGYAPAALFHYFEEISAVPRGSGNEKAISDYLAAFARKRGFWVHQDKLHNVVIKKPASPGAEAAPAVMLQGHMDMVCEKRAGIPHDFMQDGLELIVRDGILSANGTTLGADNGVAVALMLAVLDGQNLRHPALECVFTAQEETGLIGAAGLDKTLLHARTMINLDSEEEGVATVSCAGGMRFTLTRAITRTKTVGTQLHLSISGLLGGHSGTDIDKERQNANILMARMLSHLLCAGSGMLADFSGGTKDNAIPRECHATLLYADPADAAHAKAQAREFAQVLAAEICPDEPDFACAIETMQGSVSVLQAEDAHRLIRAVRLAPNGVCARNMKENGFVTTSLNLGIVCVTDAQMKLVFAPRSSVASLQENTTERLHLLADTFGFSAETTGAYPGWQFAQTSPIRTQFQESYRRLFGQELRVEALHAGLECGLFSNALPGLDAIAVGPTILGCHTPDERLPLDSFARFYRLLCDVLARLASGNIHKCP